jgi:hypothetical protein
VRSNVTEAIAEGTDLLETLALEHFGEFDQSTGSSGRVSDPSKELLEILFILVVPGWELFDCEFISLPKEIGHKDLSVQGLGQDIGSLQSLGEIARLAGWCPIDILHSRRLAHPKIS